LAVSRTLLRLQSIREAEERQIRAQMESAQAELRRLEKALMNNFERSRGAQALLASSVRSDEQVDRVAALQELATAERVAKILLPRIAVAETAAGAIRQEFLAKRIERRQVESLLDAANERLAIEAKRKSQTALDDWHNAQRTRKNRRSHFIVPGI
jgi:hypothetical protein